ncbi:hypothetical protein Q5P01_006530 [Channa striata]|uniref:Uncharacterized protein n=1 Tax=Channa striata TaxID=64152 RepID=A0AA88NEG8_CHASR|nr:hypothetical protein Q5P01_006530 [Channa striata]
MKTRWTGRKLQGQMAPSGAAVLCVVLSNEHLPRLNSFLGAPTGLTSHSKDSMDVGATQNSLYSSLKWIHTV